jgi:hypothetical protein
VSCKVSTTCGRLLLVLLLMLLSLLVAAGHRLQEGSVRLDCWASDVSLLLLVLLLMPVALLSVLLLQSVLDLALLGAPSCHVLLFFWLMLIPVLSAADGLQQTSFCGDCALRPLMASS